MVIPSILLSSSGALPHSARFTSRGVTQIFQVSGSAWTGNQPALIGANILIDGQYVGNCIVFSNANSSHAALVSQPVITRLAPGDHTLQLTALNGETNTDVNDRFNVLMSELEQA